MNYQRILMLTDLGADPRPACQAIRRFAPSATHVTVIAQQPPRLFAWATPAAPPDLNDAARRTLDGQEIGEARSQVAGDVLDDDRQAVRLGIDGHVQLVVADVRKRLLGEL